MKKKGQRKCPLYPGPKEIPICGAGSEVIGIACTEKDLLKCEHITCYGCESNKNCEFSFDPYNTHGECLALK